MLDHQNINIEEAREKSNLLKEIVIDGNSRAKHIHDFKLLECKIGFTDLVLRCTRSAQELSMHEKMNNVPRLLKEFKESKARNIVIVGKGIWEIIIKYIQKHSLIKQKEFTWGKQTNPYSEWLKQTLSYNFDVFVFPSTSGLVTIMKYNQKLTLWNEILN